MSQEVQHVTSSLRTLNNGGNSITLALVVYEFFSVKLEPSFRNKFVRRQAKKKIVDVRLNCNRISKWKKYLNGRKSQALFILFIQ